MKYSWSKRQEILVSQAKQCIDLDNAPPPGPMLVTVPALIFSRAVYSVPRLRNPTTCYPATEDKETMKKWQCIVCGWIYDEAEGYEDEGIAPGTAWEDVDEDFICPECGVGKADFEMIEIG